MMAFTGFYIHIQEKKITNFFLLSYKRKIIPWNFEGLFAFGFKWHFLCFFVVLSSFIVRLMIAGCCVA